MWNWAYGDGSGMPLLYVYPLSRLEGSILLEEADE